MHKVLVLFLVIATVAARPKPAHNVKATKDIRSHAMHRGFEEECSSTITKDDVLLVIDIQKDFHMASANGNGLAVPGSDDAYTDRVNEWIVTFERAGADVIYTRDWHPPDHCSFKCPFPATTQYKMKEITALIKEAHANGKEPNYDKLRGLVETCAPTPYSAHGTTLPPEPYPPKCQDQTSKDDYESEHGALVRWPPHCVQNQDGANFGKGLYVIPSALQVYKGFDPLHDSYSAWGAVTTIRHHVHDRSDIDTLPMQVAAALGGKAGAGLNRRIFVLGLATDYCVMNTVKDFSSALHVAATDPLAKRFRVALGLNAEVDPSVKDPIDVVFVADGSRGVNPPPLTTNVKSGVEKMIAAGAVILPPIAGSSIPQYLESLCTILPMSLEQRKIAAPVTTYLEQLEPTKEGVAREWNGVIYK